MIALSKGLNDYQHGFYYEKSFRQIIEDHIGFLQIRYTDNEVSVAPHIAYKYDRNFYGLLKELNYPNYLHWIILRANGFYNPSDYNYHSVVITVPDFSFIEQLMKTYTAMESYI